MLGSYWTKRCRADDWPLDRGLVRNHRVHVKSGHQPQSTGVERASGSVPAFDATEAENVNLEGQVQMRDQIGKHGRPSTNDSSRRREGRGFDTLAMLLTAKRGVVLPWMLLIYQFCYF